MHDVFHWPPISQRNKFRRVPIGRYWLWQLGSTTAYLREFSCPTSSLTARRNLRPASASGGELLVPFAPNSKTQRRALSVVWPITFINWPSSRSAPFLATTQTSFISI